MRHLRFYESTAKTNHFCNYCMHQILSGEKYSGDVYASDKHGIFVVKQHVNPGCEPDPDDEFFNSSFETEGKGLERELVKELNQGFKEVA